ncbi:hypothetical protein [Sphingomonas sp. BK069]|uniref:hypothetical protein n=1 Tax=Sphingomonas sp. BK069 TaxID=2586979 RepID=UPI001621B5DC|nr:hypothetical protein [Sphingomonas sp. BK069]
MAIINTTSFDHTIQHSLRLNHQFRSAANAIEVFRRSHGRLPNAREFGAVSPSAGPEDYEIVLAPAGFQYCDRDTTEFAKMAGPDYVLAAWRGEWWECYAPTRHISTLLLDRAAYSMFGAAWLDTLVFLTFAAASMAAALKLSVRRKPAGDPTR